MNGTVLTGSVFVLIALALLVLLCIIRNDTVRRYRKFFIATEAIYLSGTVLLLIVFNVIKGITVPLAFVSEFLISMVYSMTVFAMLFIAKKAGMLMENQQISRIVKYESIFNETLKMMEDPDNVNTEDLRKNIDSLESYYTSEEWKKDYADDEAGVIPNNIKRGVLSQDGISDLLDKYQQMSRENF